MHTLIRGAYVISKPGPHNRWPRAHRGAQAAMASGEGTSGSAPPVTLGSTASPSSRSERPERTSGTAWSTSRCFFRCEGAASAFLAIFSGCRLMAPAEVRVRGGVGGLAALARDPLRAVLGTTLPAGVLLALHGAPLVCFQAERCEESSRMRGPSTGRVDDLSTVAIASAGTFVSGQKGVEAGSIGDAEGRWNDLAAGLSVDAGAALLSASASPQMEKADMAPLDEVGSGE